MLTLIGKADYTSYIPHESIKIDAVAGDPAGKASFQVVDPGAQIGLSALQEVIFIDETVVLGTTTLTPAHNYLNNNNFNYGSGGWTPTGALSGLVSFPSSGTFGASAKITITFSNAAAADQAAAYQFIPTRYIVAGQQYCASGTVTTASLSHAYAFIEIVFYDAAFGVLGDYETDIATNTSGRFSVTGTAPTGTAYILINVGGTTTQANSNAGTITITALQLEPVWFADRYSYPTPICDFLQADSVTLPDGTATRFDRIFCGNITHLAAHYEGTTRTWSVEATSLDGWLENVTLVNTSYAGATDQGIITGIVNGLPSAPVYAATPSLQAGTPQALAYRNVPIVYSGITISSIEYADATVREVLNSLADITGFLFGVDAYYNVFYYPPFYNAAPYGFGPSPDNSATFAYYDYSIEYDGTQIQNAIKVSGGMYQLSTTETWNAQDGSHSEGTSGGNTINAVLLHKPVSVPSSIVVGGSAKTCALETNTGFGSVQSLCNTGYPYVSFLSSIAPGTSISITYIYEALVYVLVQSPDSIAGLGRPLYSKINDTNLGSNAAAATRGEAQLQAYAQPRVTLKFKTQKLLSPGQIIEFTSALDGLSQAHYSVQKVTATYLGNGINEYDVQAGTYVDDFVDFFRNTQKAVNRASHSVTEPIKQYNNLQQDSTSYTDSLSIHT